MVTKLLAFITLGLLCTASVQMNHRAIVAKKRASGGAPPPTYLVDQTFEGSGYDNGETWTASGLEVDPNYTTVTLEGSESLMADGVSTPAEETAYTEFTAQSELWVYFKFRCPDDTEDQYVMDLLASGGGGNGLTVYGSATYGWYIATDDFTGPSAMPFAEDTTYHVWVHYVSGGTCEFFVSTDGVRPTTDTSSTVYLARTRPSGSNIGRILLRANSNSRVIFDRVLVSTGAIGNNP